MFGKLNSINWNGKEEENQPKELVMKNYRITMRSGNVYNVTGYNEDEHDLFLYIFTDDTSDRVSAIFNMAEVEAIQVEEGYMSGYSAIFGDDNDYH